MSKTQQADYQSVVWLSVFYDGIAQRSGMTISKRDRQNCKHLQPSFGCCMPNTICTFHHIAAKPLSSRILLAYEDKSLTQLPTSNFKSIGLGVTEFWHPKIAISYWLAASHLQQCTPQIENSWFLCLKFVKIRDFTKFLKFVKKNRFIISLVTAKS